MSDFDLAQDFTAKWEGCLSDDAADRGGLTHWGVSMAFLSDLEYSRRGTALLKSIGVRPLPVNRETIKALTKEQAKAIFKAEFWDRLHLDELPVQMAVLIYDAAVNSGRAQSVKLAQRGFNACDCGESLEVDGVLGPLTIDALSSHNTQRVRQSILDSRVDFYWAIVNKRPSQKVFIRGWLNRVNDLREYVEGL